MKKKLVVLLMASSMALAACSSEPAATPTASETAVETEATTEATEASSEEAESSDEAETSEEAESSDEAAVADIDLSALADMDFKTSLEMTGVTVEEANGGYVLNYPAGLMSEDEIKAAEVNSEVTVNDDGSVSVVVDAESYTVMEDAYNEAMSSITTQ